MPKEIKEKKVYCKNCKHLKILPKEEGKRRCVLTCKEYVPSYYKGYCPAFKLKRSGKNKELK